MLSNEEGDICIIAHSKGCDIVLIALQELQPRLGEKLQKRVYAYGFGGVALIPKNLGRVVENYLAISEQTNFFGGRLMDGIAKWGGLFNSGILGSWLSDDDPDSYVCKKIYSPYSALDHLHDFEMSYSSKAIEILKEFK